ncbi:MAG: hypothetical protein R2764_16855 [Bacteroidales bacterium]
MAKNTLRFPNKEKPEFINELREKVNHYFTENNISKYGNGSIVIKSVLIVTFIHCPLYLNDFRRNFFSSRNIRRLDCNGNWNGWNWNGIDA